MGSTDEPVVTEQEPAMSRPRTATLVLAVAAVVSAGVPARASAPSCPGFTVQHPTAAAVPPGVSTRALMEGRNYPHMCR